jgi:paraquat-inducible protein B
MRKHILHSVEKVKTGWYIWLFPLFAIGITGWLLYDYYNDQGPRVRITFEDAAGIQPEKTTLRFRGIAIGVVKDVFISEDQKDVVAEVLLRRDAKSFAVEGSKFSLVQPKVGFQGISGLNTLFEGVYIQVLPGDPAGKEKIEFNSHASSSSTDPLDDTSVYYLETDNAESVNQGDSISYRGVKIGSVTKVYFDKPAQTVQMQVNVENKYTRVIRTNTAFWRKAGIQANLGLFNSSIKVNSLDTLMNGGIEIATPDQAGERAKHGHKFNLAPGAPKDYQKWKPSLSASGASNVGENPAVRL